VAQKRKRKPKPRTPKEEAAQRPLNGVLVSLVPAPVDEAGEGGGLVMNIQALGETKITEIVSLLGLARNQAEKELGID
jgi:hypothetical protein